MVKELTELHHHVGNGRSWPVLNHLVDMVAGGHGGLSVHGGHGSLQPGGLPNSLFERLEDRRGPDHLAAMRFL